MQKFLPVVLATLLLAAMPVAHASSADDACASMGEARGHLVTMLGSSNKAANDELKAKVHAASAKVDAALAAMLKSYNASDEGKASSVKPVWEAFKNTRETEIIPAIYAGKQAEAKAAATGVQAERMKQMRGTLGCK